MTCRGLSVYGTVPAAEQSPAPRIKFREVGRRDGESYETGPKIVHGLVGRVDHVGGIETVVPQFVKHDLVGWKIFTTLRELRQNLVQSEQKGAFAELVAVRSVLEVTDRGDGEQEFLVRMPPDHIHKKGRRLADREPSAGKFPRVDLEAVGDGLARTDMFVNPRRSEGDYDLSGLVPFAGSV